MKKGALEISFPWLFAIIAGIFILFIAIYTATKIINLGQYSQDLKSSKEIGILLNPLESGGWDSSNSFTMPVETRIYALCNEKLGDFGKQKIRVQQMSFGKWTDTDTDVSFENKYIFSNNPIEGKKFFVFSKPFYFPYKVADLIYLTSSEERYCFENAPDKIKWDLEEINQENIETRECSDNSIRVCFGNLAGCDVNVNTNLKFVEKNKERVYFEGESLMFAAIFSEKEVYECQIKRLMERDKNLALLYVDKARLVKIKNCDTNIENDLLLLSESADKVESSENLNFIARISEELGSKNEKNRRCPLW